VQKSAAILEVEVQSLC